MLETLSDNFIHASKVGGFVHVNTHVFLRRITKPGVNRNILWYSVKFNISYLCSLKHFRAHIFIQTELKWAKYREARKTYEHTHTHACTRTHIHSTAKRLLAKRRLRKTFDKWKWKHKIYVMREKQFRGKFTAMQAFLKKTRKISNKEPNLSLKRIRKRTNKT